MRFDILTLFPEVFPAYLDASLLGRAQARGLLEVHLWNIREYASDKHKTVDDTPYGGGPGMVMKVEPIDQALAALNHEIGNHPPSLPPSLKLQRTRKLRGTRKLEIRRTVVLSARGEQFTQATAQEYAKLEQLVLICGRYEGIDQRVADHLADEEISIGPYVLAGGEVAALAVVEAAARLIPGVLGSPESLHEESFTTTTTYPLQPTTLIEYPQYTKPEEYRGWEVPKVLRSGNHEEIRKWRQRQSRHTMNT